jgi:hypothetical protein
LISSAKTHADTLVAKINDPLIPQSITGNSEIKINFPSPVDNGTIGRLGSIDPTEGGHTERYNANLILSHAFSESLSLVNQAFYTRNIFSLYSDFTFYLNDPINADEINQAEKRNIWL